MWALLVVEANPVANDPQGIDLALKAVAMHALLLECPDDALHHSVLLLAVGCNEFLFQAVAPHQPCVVTAGEDLSVVFSRRVSSASRPLSRSAARACRRTCCAHVVR